jgi:hypothetical protein
LFHFWQSAVKAVVATEIFARLTRLRGVGCRGPEKYAEALFASKLAAAWKMGMRVE